MATDITSALITYGLISTANHDALKSWFTTLFAQVQAGNTGAVLSTNLAGRSFTFAADDLTVGEAFAQCGRALNILSGRAATRAIGRF